MTYMLVACLLTCNIQATGLTYEDCARKARLGDVRVYTEEGETSSGGYRFTCRPELL